MRVIGVAELGDKSVEVKELTVAEIRQWLASKKDLNDLIAALLFEEMSLDDLPVISNLLPADIDGLAPSEIEKVIEKAKEVNPRFFAMREKLAEIGKAMQLSQAQSELPALNTPSPA